MPSKSEIRTQMRKARREHADGLPEQVRALVFHRPPAPVLELLPHDAVIGLYQAEHGEAPASGYAKFFQERGHTLALPFLADRESAMTFRVHTDPFEQSDLVEGSFGLYQPAASAKELAPDVLFVPLIAFTADGNRLGQGGGHYDRWVADHPQAIRIGLGWDIQEVDALPLEPHDQRLHAVVTPTRFLGPFDA